MNRIILLYFILILYGGVIGSFWLWFTGMLMRLTRVFRMQALINTIIFICTTSVLFYFLEGYSRWFCEGDTGCPTLNPILPLLSYKPIRRILFLFASLGAGNQRLYPLFKLPLPEGRT